MLFKRYRVMQVPFTTDVVTEHARREHTVHAQRWLHVHKYVSSLAEGSYHWILLADVSDTVFQTDPFAPVAGGAAGMYFFLEYEPMTIERCGYNSNWVRIAYGDEVLSKVGREHISCSGTSMGTLPHVKFYLEVLANEVNTRPGTQNVGMDQGAYHRHHHSRRRCRCHSRRRLDRHYRHCNDRHYNHRHHNHRHYNHRHHNHRHYIHRHYIHRHYIHRLLFRFPCLL